SKYNYITISWDLWVNGCFRETLSANSGFSIGGNLYKDFEAHFSLRLTSEITGAARFYRAASGGLMGWSSFQRHCNCMG
ncbi:MAG: hypothetical protein P9E24_15365, partial [Candidatus Competibacter sp.]|nr:hypothetical protein [Candidatus Competibacter sp.]MDG4583003.1 hypothetical protein [Candidatus Competibacter sp.]